MRTFEPRVFRVYATPPSHDGSAVVGVSNVALVGGGRSTTCMCSHLSYLLNGRCGPEVYSSCIKLHMENCIISMKIIASIKRSLSRRAIHAHNAVLYVTMIPLNRKAELSLGARRGR